MTVEHIPIETSLGVLFGRDCIFLDAVSFSDVDRVLHIEGEIGGDRLANGAGNVWIPYELKFINVLWYQQRDLDSDWTWEASFEERKNTPALRRFPTAKHHYFVQTYDDIFDVLCESFEFKTGMERVQA